MQTLAECAITGTAVLAQRGDGDVRISTVTVPRGPL